MNYYERHIGDYLKDTAHLSLLEHGVYGRLLDVYYTREGAIPVIQVERLVGARSKDERAALAEVIDEFFSVEADCLHHARCDREIERYQKKAERNRTVGKLGGRPKKTQTQPEPTTEPTENPDGFKPEPTKNPHQSPVTSSEAKASAAEAAAEKSKAELWRAAVAVLQDGGCKSEAICRSFMGKLVGDYTLPIVQEAVAIAASNQPADAREYLKATCMRLKGERAADHGRPLTVPNPQAEAATKTYLQEQAEHKRVVEQQRLARLAAKETA